MYKEHGRFYIKEYVVVLCTRNRVGSIPMNMYSVQGIYGKFYIEEDVVVQCTRNRVGSV